MLTDNNKHTWCVNPYINMAIEPNGKVSPCCRNYQYHYKTKSGNETIDKESIINFWNSPDRLSLIDKLESGHKEKTCYQCWDEEAAGKVSHRQISNEQYLQHFRDTNQLPTLFYIAAGNTCNLKCRICHTDRSSKVVEEEKSISLLGKIKVSLDKELKTGRRSFDKDNKNFWEDLIILMPSARYVYFSGGEPLYVKNNQKFIADLVQKDYAKNIDISLTSNGTLYLEKTMNLLKQFKSVGINFSIDGIGEKFNYIRHPGNFDDWVKNVLRIKKENPQWFIQTIISISMFNVWDFAETYEFCKINDLNPTINFVHDNRSAKFMPQKLKEKVIKKLMEYKSLDPQWISYRESIINFLNNSKHNYLTWKMFWYECKQRDKFRKENFQEVFPEYYNEIKNYI